jgi:undecaprenyl-diphosphatase
MDQKLLFLINREWTSGVADRVMALASSWDVWLPFAAILVLLFLVRGRFRERAYVAVLVLIVGFNDGVVSSSLKKLINRPRPHQAMADVRVVDLKKARPRLLAVFSPPKVKLSQPTLTKVDGRSMPSSHTINMFSAALVTVAFYGAGAAWTFAVAALIAYSRMYVGSHWPSDVITSIFIGLGSSLLLLAASESLWRRYGGRWLPAVHDRHPHLFAA